MQHPEHDRWQSPIQQPLAEFPDQHPVRLHLPDIQRWTELLLDHESGHGHFTRQNHLGRTCDRQPGPLGSERHIDNPMKRLRRLIGRDERGATLIEFCLIFTLLLVLALGAFEYGRALRAWQAETIATREGTRVAASAANYQAADCTILEATTGALRSFKTGHVREVHIYKSDESGTYNGSTANRYRPLITGEDTSSLSLVACGASTWVALATPWGPAARLN